MSEEKQYPDSVKINVHKSFVQAGLVNSTTGKSFNLVTLAKGTVISGHDLEGKAITDRDVSGFKFSPLFVHDSPGGMGKFIPLPADKEVWLTKQLSEQVGDGKWTPKLDGDGKQITETVVVTPQDLKVAIDEARKAYLAQHPKDKDKGSKTPLDDRLAAAKAAESQIAETAGSPKDAPVAQAAL